MAEDDLLIRVGLTEKQYLATLARMEKASMSAANKAERAFQKSNTTIARSTESVGRAAGNSSHQLRMMSLQLSQVAQQGAATGDYLKALAIQIPDLALGFGAVGVALGAVVPIIYSATQGFLSNRQGAQDLDSALKELKRVSDELSDPMEILTLTVDELAIKYGEAADRVRDFAIFQGELRVEQATQLLRDQISFVLSLASAYVTSSTEGYRFEQVLKRIQEAFGVNRDAAIQLENAFQGLFTASDFSGQQAALEQINTLLREQKVSVADIPPEIAQALSDMITYSNEVDAAAKLAADLQGAMEDVAAGTGSAADQASRLASELARAIALMPITGAMMDEDVAMGQQVTPTAASRDRQRQALENFNRITAPRPTRGGGGGGRGSGNDRLQSELERVQQALMSQAELEMQAFDRQQETLQQALERQLLTREEYQRLTEEAQQRHADRMAQIDVYRYGTGLQQAKTFFGGMATAFQQGTDKMQRIASAFAAIESVINAYRAYNQVLADPSLPFFAKIPAAASVLAAGLNAAKAIKGVGGGGGGGAVAGAEAAAATTAPQASRNVTIQFTGDQTGMMKQLAQQLIPALNEAFEDGATLVRVV